MTTSLQGGHEAIYEIVRELRKRKEEISGTIDMIDNFFQNETKWHVRKESVILSLLEKKGSKEQSIVSGVYSEHTQIREMYSEFEDLLANLRKAGLDELLNLIEKMMQMVETHALREDAVLLPLANQVLNKKEMDEAIAKIRSIEQQQQEIKK